MSIQALIFLFFAIVVSFGVVLFFATWSVGRRRVGRTSSPRPGLPPGPPLWPMDAGMPPSPPPSGDWHQTLPPEHAYARHLLPHPESHGQGYQGQSTQEFLPPAPDMGAGFQGADLSSFSGGGFDSSSAATGGFDSSSGGG